MGSRKYRYHSPLISAEWCTFTNVPWGRGPINFETPEEEALAMETYEAQGTSVQTGVWQASATLTGRMDTCIRPTDNRSCDLCTSAKDERGEKNLKWSYRARVPHEGEAEMYQVRLKYSEGKLGRTNSKVCFFHPEHMNYFCTTN